LVSFHLEVITKPIWYALQPHFLTLLFFTALQFARPGAE